MANAKTGRPPAFQFYPADYLSDYKTRRLTIEQHGAYLVLLAVMWHDSPDLCSMPKDASVLSSVWGCTPKRAAILIEALQVSHARLFLEEEREDGSYLVSKRLRDEAISQNAYSALMSESGKAGADKRWKKDGGAIASSSEAIAIDSSSTALASASTSTSSTASTNTPNARVGDIAKVGREYERLTGQTAPVASLVALCAVHTTERIVEGIRLAAESGKPQAQYIAGIVKRLARDGWKPEVEEVASTGRMHEFPADFGISKGGN